LQEDRWRGAGFDTLEGFAASIQFDKKDLFSAVESGGDRRRDCETVLNGVVL